MIDREKMIEAAADLGPVLQAAARVNEPALMVAKCIIDGLDVDAIKASAKLSARGTADEETSFQIAKAVVTAAKAF